MTGVSPVSTYVALFWFVWLVSDSQQCSSNNRECQYRPSRRGGARRGTKYQIAKKERTVTGNDVPITTIPSPVASSKFECTFDDLKTKHCGSVDEFADDTPDVDHSMLPFPNAREFAPRSNARSPPTIGFYGEVGTATNDDAAHHVPEVVTLRSYENSQNL